jgi:hypothetical protein
VGQIVARNIRFNDWIQLANGLPESGRVKVFYNPDDPGESVLISGNARQSWDGIGFGAIFSGFAAVWMTFWWLMSNWLPDRFEKITTRGGGGDADSNG